MERVFALLLLAMGAVSSSPLSPSFLPKPYYGEPWMDPFLPSSLEPVHYDLYQNPDFYFDGSTFSGRVSIVMNVLNSTDLILVHIKALNITATRVYDRNGNRLTLEDTFAYEPNQYWVVQTLNPLPEGSTATLELDFTGSLTNGIVGYYKSTYVHDVTGITR